jgi:HAD superfamily hydrolase (TIGR01509 family)
VINDPERWPALAAVLFDLDGTLVDSERENVESVVLACRRLGVELTADDRRFIVGHSWNEIHALIAREHGIAVSMDDLIARAVDEKRALVAVSGHRALPHAVETVRRFAERWPLAIVSGGSRVEVRDALEGIDVRRYFKVVLAAEDYPRGKPSPDPYLAAMAALGVAGAPGRCLVIEDAAPGVAAGKAAGARVIGVQVGNFVGYDLSAADVVVETLADVTDQLLSGLLA